MSSEKKCETQNKVSLTLMIIIQHTITVFPVFVCSLCVWALSTHFNLNRKRWWKSLDEFAFSLPTVLLRVDFHTKRLFMCAQIKAAKFQTVVRDFNKLPQQFLLEWLVNYAIHQLSIERQRDCYYAKMIDLSCQHLTVQSKNYQWWIMNE